MACSKRLVIPVVVGVTIIAIGVATAIVLVVVLGPGSFAGTNVLDKNIQVNVTTFGDSMTDAEYRNQIVPDPANRGYYDDLRTFMRAKDIGDLVILDKGINSARVKNICDNIRGTDPLQRTVMTFMGGFNDVLFTNGDMGAAGEVVAELNRTLDFLYNENIVQVFVLCSIPPRSRFETFFELLLKKSNSQRLGKKVVDIWNKKEQ